VLENLPPTHPYFTRLQRTRGAMDLVVRQMFDDLIHRFDAFHSEFDGLGSRLDRRFTETEAVRSEHDPAVDSRLDSLEQFASAQYTAAIVADNWGGHFSERVHDLEMVRYVEIQDERDERVTALEFAAEAFEAWRPRIESSLFTIRSEVDRLSKLWDRSSVAPNDGYPEPKGILELVAGRAPTGATTDWPSGHGVASPTRDAGYGSVTTIAPFLANVTLPAPNPPPPPLQFPPPPPPPHAKQMLSM